METPPANYYPVITIQLPQNPNRFYAIPLVGVFVKFVMVIPVILFLLFLSILFPYVLVINAFVVLATGTYWDTAYRYFSGVMRLSIKMIFFFWGFTDKYPGFDFTINDNFSIEIEKPKNPNKFFAIPLVGFFLRILLLIPFIAYLYVMQLASFTGVVFSWILVLFSRRYPETSFELARDYARLSLAYWIYIVGISDAYPSFSISWNHKRLKIVLIVVSILWLLLNIFTSAQNSSSQTKQRPNYYYPQQNYNYSPRS